MNEGSGAVSVCVRREGEADESFAISVATSDSSPVQAEGIVIYCSGQWIEKDWLKGYH